MNSSLRTDTLMLLASTKFSHTFFEGAGGKMMVDTVDLPVREHSVSQGSDIYSVML